jgi:ADP-ribose pyrophosphatase
MDEGETPEMTANREMIEETGFRAKQLVPRGYIYSTPGFTTEKLYMFEARDLVPSDDYQMDDDEDIEVVKVSRESALKMISDGSIVDAKTICVISKCLLL